MKRMRTLLIGLLSLSTLVVAASPEYLAVIDNTAMAEIQTGDLDIDFGALGYESTPKSVPGVRRDINNDGTEDLILRGSIDYCGTGGCSLYIIDGRRKKKIGAIFGSPLIIHATTISGWPVLSVYSHGSATSGSYTTFVHNGLEYIQATSIMLYDESVTELFRKLRSTNGKSP